MVAVVARGAVWWSCVEMARIEMVLVLVLLLSLAVVVLARFQSCQEEHHGRPICASC